jgi:hypothetical protein
MNTRALHLRTLKNRLMPTAGNLIGLWHGIYAGVRRLRCTTLSVFGSVEDLCADILCPLDKVPGEVPVADEWPEPLARRITCARLG